MNGYVRSWLQLREMMEWAKAVHERDNDIAAAYRVSAWLKTMNTLEEINHLGDEIEIAEKLR